MAKSIKLGIGDKAHNVIKPSIGINNIAKKVAGGWVGDENGIAQRFYTAESPIGNLAVGKSVFLNVNGARTEFIVVHQGLPSDVYDESCDGTWLLMKNLYTKAQWDTTDNDYANSDIRAYLDNTFINLLDSGMRAAIKQVTIPYYRGTGLQDANIMAEKSISFTSNSAQISSALTLSAGLDYVVTWGGIPYKCKCYMDNYGEAFCLGNGALFDMAGKGDSDCPFLIMSDTLFKVTTLYKETSDAQTFTVRIHQAELGGYAEHGENGLSTKVFLLSGYELGWTTSTNKSFPMDGACLDYFVGTGNMSTKRAASYEGGSYASTWWTRSCQTKNTTSIWSVLDNGSGAGKTYSYEYGVRPAFILPQDAKVDGSFNIVTE